jgi:hypothetical protein
LYPAAGTQLSVAPRDFMLSVGDGPGVTPVDADEIVPGPKALSTTPSAGPPVDVQVRETVGYSSGPGPYRGVYTDSQVNVANSGGSHQPYPQFTRNDREFEMHRALMDNELPDAKTGKPIAGYLYFRKPKGMKKGDAFELRYYGGSERLKLNVPPANVR